MMKRIDPRWRRPGAVGLVLVAVVALLLAACGSSGSTTAASSTKAAMSTTGMAGTSSGQGSAGASGMSMGGSGSGGMSAGGIKAVPTQKLASTTWQGMKISAEAMTAVPFVIYKGPGDMQMVKPPKTTAFHLMVMLSDQQTGVPIPYATVWATISKGGKVIYDERQWPMISRYMGPHYGNDVAVPGAGTYQLSLLISPPVSARHVEYQDVWMKPHRVSFTFHWKPAA
ncbi:MAG TPA: iron transporter [Solirubrobacteraceae bacterium]|nr:iron transporter [Solirubrobacteraceae bacterium]